MIYAGLATTGANSEQMAQMLQQKKPGMALNFRNSTLSVSAMKYLTNSMANSAFYLTALSFKFCYLSFDDLLLLSDGIKFNKTMIKLDLSSNALKSCMVKFFFESLLDNYCLAHLDLSSNFLDNEFAVDLAHLLE